MTSSPASAARLARLLRELAVDLQGLDARTAEIGLLLTGWTPQAAPRHTVIIAAVNIHGWYTALEAALERTARLLDETVPTGPGWHAELISQMASTVPGLRPSIIDPDLEIALSELRKFRHFFRNAYVLEFEARLVREQADRVIDVHGRVRAGLDRLQSHLSAVLKKIASE
jgi:hypothetical protein